ncbi:MAG: class SAM-dependent methyltransferase [Microbacteriaceae bacterium]|jgi:SAM-dependent methyltransferase|nr:class SAM-dependent methyltransferase [Microbacteriaceae bacterium]
MADFDDLIAEGEAVPVAGWDFSWFEGRAIEEPTSWGYSRRLPPLYAEAQAVLDLQTGGGEVFAGALARTDVRPSLVAATEAWEPNLELARRALAPFDATVAHLANDAPLPFADASFGVVSSRHPIAMPWSEVARVLEPGGITISQQVTPLATNRELYEFFLGPQGYEPEDGVALIQSRVAEAGLELVDLRYEESKVEFFDLAAVVYFLRKVLWTVPDFTVERYRDKLIELHAEIEERGSFVSYSRHALVVALRQ